MKSDFINCKNCTDDCHCKGKNITPICISFKPAKITNADCIRSMADEELARLFADENCGYCRIHDFCFAKGCQIDCEDMWLDWLKEEAKE